jgi:hypothetical protein
MHEVVNQEPIGSTNWLPMRSSTPTRKEAVRSKSREVDGHLRVEVSDDGASLPAGLDIDQRRASLGFKVVSGMVRQLQGHLTLAKIARGHVSCSIGLFPPRRPHVNIYAVEYHC